MACNCGKNQQRPNGATGKSATAKSQQQIQREGAKAQAQNSKTQSFELKTRDGRTQSFSRRLDADAARVRAGGGTIRPV